MQHHVFAYGSLMFDEVWSRVVAGRYRRLPATLHGYRRQLVRGQDYPALQRLPDRAGPVAAIEGPAGVAGQLYLDVDGTDLARLDAFEGADYLRIVVDVLPDAGPRRSLAAATYLFIAEDRIEAGDWDPAWFRREALARFLRDHVPAGG